MGWWERVRRRVAVLVRRERFDADLEAEMQAHLEMRALENQEDGMDPEEARYAARRQFGNLLRLREESRESWGWQSVERIGQDVRQALRMVRKNPGFAVIALLIVGLGIGGSSTVFSLVNAFVLNPFPYPEADRLMEIQSRRKGESWRTTVVIRDYFDFRAESRVFEEIAAYGWFRTAVTGLGEPERMIGGTATAGFLRVLGIQPALGRWFTAAEDAPGGAAVVVLSHGMWQRRFGGQEDVLGRTLTANGRAYTIVGVMPARLALPGMFTCEFWRPAAYDPFSERGSRMDGDRLVGRLKPGVPVARAQAELAVIAGRLEWEYPESNRGWEVLVAPIGRELAREAGGFLAGPALAVGLVLLIACTNLAGLLLARGSGRAKEMALRASLGAGRGRLAGQMLAEAVLLSLAGGGLGLVLARWGIQGLIAAGPANAGLGSALRLDGPVVGFALAASVLTGLCFGLVPAAYGSKPDLNALLKSGAGASTSRPRNRLLAALVVAQVGLALVLLVSGGLVMKSLGRLLETDLGIRTEHLLTFQLGLPGSKYGSGGRRAEFYRALIERLRAVPGVREASAVSPLPLSGEYSGGGFRIEGRPAPARWQDMAAQYLSATPGYFRSMAVPLLAGRDFEERDQRALIINQTLARRFFPGESPIGRRINGTEIVGVVGDVRHNGPGREFAPQIYSAFGEQPPAWVSIVVQTAIEPMNLAPAVRTEVRALDPDLPLDRLRTMRQVVADSVAGARMLGWILGGFSAFALALAALGIYGVVASSVNQRTAEIGIRMALGASRGAVLAQVVRRGLLLGVAGVAIGVPAALAATRVMESLLYGVKPGDVVVFTGVAAVLLGAALAASFLPARRAAEVDPVVALRCE